VKIHVKEIAHKKPKQYTNITFKPMILRIEFMDHREKDIFKPLNLMKEMNLNNQKRGE